MGVEHSATIFYCEARYLSGGKFLQRVFELGNEKRSVAKMFRDGSFLIKLTYLVDIFEKLIFLTFNFKEPIHIYWKKVIEFMFFVENCSCGVEIYG